MIIQWCKETFRIRFPILNIEPSPVDIVVLWLILTCSKKHQFMVNLGLLLEG
jgi:hypothetical protein